MDTISGIPLTKAILILGVVLAVTEGRPGTNFAGSSITSDSSGTRSSHLVGTIPDNSQSYSSDPSTRIYTSKNPGTGDGTTILTTRNGGGAVLTGTSSNRGGTVVAGTSSNGSGAVLAGTSSNGGGGVGILSRSGPSSTGTQYSVLGTSNQPQPSVLGRFGNSQPSTGFSGPSAGFGGVGAGSGAFAGPSGASSGAYAGAGGSSAGAYAGPVHSNYDYYG